MRRLMAKWIVSVLGAVVIVAAATAVAAKDLTTVQVNLNQVGYLAAEQKIALVETSRNLVSEGGSARVLMYPGLTPGPLPDIPISVDRRGYGKYRHNYEVDFSALVAVGSYVIQIRDGMGGVLTTSPPTAVSAAPFNGAIPGIVRFFGEQRCGNSAPLVHAACHTDDGVAVGGPQNGSPVDVSGGWHDAGDYIKFASTTSFATMMQLFALRQLAPPGFDPSLRTQIRGEARQGVEWLLRAHPTATAFYFQVADTRDHDAGWRLPEDDTVFAGPRPAYYGLGANLAGRTAAALALCAMEWQTDDPPLAASCSTAAQEIYALGKSIVNGTSSDPKQALVVSCVETPADYSANRMNCGFYEESSWEDDMALGAVELYQLTSTSSFLTDALTYAQAAGPAYSALGITAVNDVALYEVYPHAPPAGPGFTQAQVLAFLQTDAELIRDQANRDRYNVGEKRFLWGSSENLAADAVTALLYAARSGDATYRRVAQWQRDFILGRNPFGACFLAGAGSVYPLQPHHGVALLLHSDWYTPGAVIGSVAGGPARRGQYPFRADSSLRAAVRGDTASPFARFQTARFQYHDILEDYVSNEPALDYDAALLAVLVAFSA